MKELGSRVVRLASLCEEDGGGGTGAGGGGARIHHRAQSAPGDYQGSGGGGGGGGGGSGGGDYYGTDGVETAEASDALNGSEGFEADHAGDGEVSVVNLVSNVRQWLSMLKSDTPEQS